MRVPSWRWQPVRGNPDLLELRLDRPGREPREPTEQPPAAPPPPPPATQVSTIRLIIDVNRCASNVANSFSVAALTGLNKNPLTKAILSNNVASLSNLIFSQSPKDYVPAGGSLVASRYAGTAVVKAGQVAAGIEVNQGFQSIFTTIAATTLGETAAGGLAVAGVQTIGKTLNFAAPAQFFYDGAVYFGALVACTQ